MTDTQLSSEDRAMTCADYAWHEDEAIAAERFGEDWNIPF